MKGFPQVVLAGLILAGCASSATLDSGEGEQSSSTVPAVAASSAEVDPALTSSTTTASRDDTEAEVDGDDRAAIVPNRPASGWLADGLGGPEFPGDPAYVTGSGSPVPDYGPVSPSKIATAIHTAWTRGPEEVALLIQYQRADPAVGEVMANRPAKTTVLAPHTCSRSTVGDVTCTVTVIFQDGGDDAFSVTYRPELDWYITSLEQAG